MIDSQCVGQVLKTKRKRKEVDLMGSIVKQEKGGGLNVQTW